MLETQHYPESYRFLSPGVCLKNGSTFQSNSHRTKMYLHALVVLNMFFPWKEAAEKHCRANLSGNFGLFVWRVTKSIAFNAETQQNYLISGRDIWRKAGLTEKRETARNLSVWTSFQKGLQLCVSQIKIPRCYSFSFLPKGILK